MAYNLLWEQRLLKMSKKRYISYFITRWWDIFKAIHIRHHIGSIMIWWATLCRITIDSTSPNLLLLWSLQTNTQSQKTYQVNSEQHT
jgi:hypothetical protein